MYLPDNLPKSKVLITVKTYPTPTPTQKEVVCTAGLINGNKWVRIYPINFRDKPFSQQFKKYSWVQINLSKNHSDRRVESYNPEKFFDEEILILDQVETKNGWEERREIICNGEVFESMTNAIAIAKENNRSLVTMKPKEVIDFSIEPVNRNWSDSQRQLLEQEYLFNFSSSHKTEVIRKLPYKYSYEFLTKGDTKSRKLMISDWEIGALFWKLLKTEENEEKVNQKIKDKYLTDFCQNKDLYFFLGTTYRNQVRAPNPYIIIGIFYPPKIFQPKLLS